MWAIKPEAKYYKYVKESELHHGRIALLIPFIDICSMFQMTPIILFELRRLYCIEKPFIIKESHDLGNYFGLNMNNKYLLIKTEMWFARIACLYIFYEYLKTIL